ncbi:uncharacterized protein B0I36DRAFT_136115 [Microdochium trichocladiopsis]|uniref:Uncharacterized protein n=1 Tax=Microdochium trichocladiopsis TaxID=1682393 RepID=A0A9P8Y103_9PEZI|nr:uncharacterized protein B0I36DRAFT_136115 [Microdochium trichocladiopsis]KAH7027195.1 hypothetical protein B0I36DRAFT_136115 [Microdochium trichocladiopsis]
MSIVQPDAYEVLVEISKSRRRRCQLPCSDAIYAGTLPNPPRRDVEMPIWWSEIEQHATTSKDKEKKVIFVVQGTVHIEYSDLIVPTLEALRDPDDLFVVATLGVKGAALPADF